MKLLRTGYGARQHVRNTVFNTKKPFLNWSSYYAMAVIELGDEVKRAMKVAGR